MEEGRGGGSGRKGEEDVVVRGGRRWVDRVTLRAYISSLFIA